MAAQFYDMQWMAQSVNLRGRVQAAAYVYAISTVSGLSGAGSQAQKNYATQVINNPNGNINNLVWACAQNLNFANAVITANGGANFTSSTTLAQVEALILNAGVTDALISAAIANAWPMLAGA